MANNDEEYLVIPQNYQNSFNLLGSVSLKYINFIQAVITGAVVVALYFLIFVYKKPWNSDNIRNMIVCFGLTAVPVAYGFKGGTIYQYLRYIIRFKKRRRVAIYNSHFKTETKQVDHDEYVVDAMVYKDRFALVWNQFRRNSIENEQRKVTSQVEAFKEYQDYYFEDDEDSIAKPEEYMTRKERRLYKKQQKKKMKGE